MKLRYTFLPGVLGAMLTAACLTSCGSSHFLAVKPSQPDSEWPDGRPSVSTNFDKLEVQLCYSHQRRSHLRTKEVLFEVEIRNGSADTIQVDPATFFYQPVIADAAEQKKNERRKKAQVAYIPDRVSAINPEVRLQQLDNKLAFEDRKSTGISALEWLSIATEVAQAVTPPKGTEQEKQAEQLRRDEQRIDNQIYFDEQRYQHAVKADQTAVELDFWAQKVLRKHTLLPGDLVHGYISFPSFDQSLLLRVSLPVRDRTLIFDFDQERKSVTYEPVAPARVATSAAPQPPASTTP